MDYAIKFLSAFLYERFGDKISLFDKNFDEMGELLEMEVNDFQL